MELIHIANATFSSLSFKTKTFRIVKEQALRWAASADHTTSRAITPAHVGTVNVGSHELASSRASRSGGRGAGGASRDRTGDLLVANQALSQLSYGPSPWWVWEELHLRPHP